MKTYYCKVTRHSYCGGMVTVTAPSVESAVEIYKRDSGYVETHDEDDFYPNDGVIFSIDPSDWHELPVESGVVIQGYHRE